MLNILKKHSSDSDVCYAGCNALRSILEGDSTAQQSIRSLGGFKILLDVLIKHLKNPFVIEASLSAVGVALSFGGTRIKPQIYGISKDIDKLIKTYSYDQRINKLIFSINRTENSSVKQAIKNKLCTNDLIPKCNDKCAYDEGKYCYMCCVQQRVFRCHTCDTKEIKFYCETCWINFHRDHKCEEFFFPTRCSGMKK